MELLGIALLVWFWMWFKNSYKNPVGESVGPTLSKYTKRRVVMDKYEQALYYLLRKHLPQEYYIFPKMRIADFVKIEHGKGFYNLRNQILSRHVDFIICDHKFSPVMAVELNGSSHMEQDRISRDITVAGVYKEVGLAFTTVKVGESFHDECIKIRDSLAAASFASA